MATLVLSSALLLGCGSASRTANTTQWTNSRSYGMSAVGAMRSDDNRTTAVMRISPYKPEKFKLILSMKVGYGESLPTKAVDIQQLPGEGKIQLMPFGRETAKETPILQAITEEKIDFDSLNGDRLLAINFTNLISNEADSLYVTYGLWEQDNINQRVEKTYGMKIENFEN